MDEQDPMAAVLAAAAWLDLAIDPRLLEGVAANLDLLRQHAARVLEFPLDDRAEAAPVFRP